MYSPVSISSASGIRGRKYTQLAGSLPVPRAMKMAATTIMKTSDTQRWVCRTNLLHIE
jgi:hypothetical protein